MASISPRQVRGNAPARSYVCSTHKAPLVWLHSQDALGRPRDLIFVSVVATANRKIAESTLRKNIERTLSKPYGSPMKPSDFESKPTFLSRSQPESSIRSRAIGAKPWLGLAHGGLVGTRKSTIRERVNTLRLGLYWHRLRGDRPQCNRPHNLDHVQWRQPEAAVCGAIA